MLPMFQGLKSLCRGYILAGGARFAKSCTISAMPCFAEDSGNERIRIHSANERPSPADYEKPRNY
jgi:hypothetical protein